jgi:hypothetical protein
VLLILGLILLTVHDFSDYDSILSDRWPPVSVLLDIVPTTFDLESTQVTRS